MPRHRRRLDSALLVLAGIARGPASGRTWMVFRQRRDNLLVQLTPYAGLPFIVLVSAILIERYMRASAEAGTAQSANSTTIWRAAGPDWRNASCPRCRARSRPGGDRRTPAPDARTARRPALLVHAQQRVESSALDRAGLARCARVDDMRLAIEALRARRRGPAGADGQLPLPAGMRCCATRACSCAGTAYRCLRQLRRFTLAALAIPASDAGVRQRCVTPMRAYGDGRDHRLRPTWHRPSRTTAVIAPTIPAPVAAR